MDFEAILVSLALIWCRSKALVRMANEGTDEGFRSGLCWLLLFWWPCKAEETNESDQVDNPTEGSKEKV